MFNPLPVVLADMRRTKAGVIAVALLIAVAVALGVAVSAQERALREGSARAADAFDLLIGAPGSPTQLVLSAVYLQPEPVELIDGRLLNELDADEGVVYAAPLAFGDFYRGHPIVGTTAAFVTRGGALAPSEGRGFAALYEAVVGADVPLAVGDRFEPLHGHPEVADPEHDTHEGSAYAVVGRLPAQDTPWDRAILVPVEAVWDVHALPTGHEEAAHGHEDDAPARLGPPWEGVVPGVPAIVVEPASVADAYRLRAEYRTTETLALFPAEVLVQLYGLLGDARDLLALIAVATQALVVGAVLLAVFASLAQRRRQVAVLRALGAPRAYVFASVWSHVTLMIAAGAALGLALGWLGAWALAALLRAETGIRLPVTVTPGEVGLALALVAVGAALAVIPALATYRQPVSAGLRSA